MDMLLMLTYAALAISAFKIFRVPVTKWTVTTAALGGVFMMSWIYISMAFFHPFTPYARTYFQTIPISADTKGKVVEVFVETDRPLKQGDPLFQVDPEPFQLEVDRLKAELILAEQHLGEMTTLIKTGSVRRTELERAQSERDSTEAQLEEAQFDLDMSTVRAPADGHVTQSRVRPGVMAGGFKVSSLMTFVIDEDPYFVAAFKPNALQNIEVGAEAEVFFTAIPGKVFKAKVKKLIGEISEGQLRSTGLKMISFSEILPPGRIPVVIEVLDDLSSYNLPEGTSAGVAVYSTHLAFLGELRRILLHMMSWQNIFSFDEAEK